MAFARKSNPRPETERLEQLAAHMLAQSYTLKGGQQALWVGNRQNLATHMGISVVRVAQLLRRLRHRPDIHRVADGVYLIDLPLPPSLAEHH